MVWIKGYNSKKIVIVHRSSRHGDEWILPKGHLKVEASEDWQEAALREVHEETGCNKNDLEIESIAGPISYLDNEGKAKVVLYYNMTCKSNYNFNCKIANNEEVDESKAVYVHEALAFLTYPRERMLLREIEPLADMKPVKFLKVRQAFKSSSHRRLYETIGPFEVELKDKITDVLARLSKDFEKEIDVVKKQAIEQEIDRINRKINAALESLECAKKALGLGEIEVGWRYLFQAELEQSAIVADEPSLKRLAVATLFEAEKKLHSWRLETVQEYLGKKGILRDKIAIGDVYRSRKIMQEHFTNMYMKLHTAGFQLGILITIALFLVIPTTLILPSLGSEVSLSNFGLLIAIVLFGALGGCFSGVFSLSREAGEGSIPDQILSSWVTLARPAVGIIAALAMAGFLLSGIIQLGTLTIPLILAVSFAVGFSERLLIKALEMKTG